MRMKVCPKCKSELPKKSFNQCARYADGLSWWCKGCNRKFSAEWYANNCNRQKSAAHSYRNANIEKVRESRAKYYQDHRDKIEAAKRAWYKKNPDFLNTYESGHRINLSDRYLKKLLRVFVPHGEIPPSLIEAKHLQLKTYRLIKEKMNEQHT